MKNKNFEYSLPGGYKLEKTMDAADFGFGLILTLGSLVLFVLCLGVLFLPLLFNIDRIGEFNPDLLVLVMAIYLVVTILYLVLHELTHGVAYKSMTGEKLTFGIKWNCAYCGVPNILTYRKTSLIALYAPFLLFTLIFVPATIWAWFYSIEAYITASLILATHISGCIGDLYMGHLLLTKYRSPMTLLNDTGPCVRVFTFDERNIGKTDNATEIFKRNLELKSNRK